MLNKVNVQDLRDAVRMTLVDILHEDSGEIRDILKEIIEDIAVPKPLPEEQMSPDGAPESILKELESKR